MRPVCTGRPAVPTPRSPARGDRVRLRAASSTAVSAAEAVAEVAAELGNEADLILAFVPDRYEGDEAADALTTWAGSRLIACTSAGGIGPEGFVRDGLVAVTLTGPDMTVRTVPISPLSDLEAAWGLAADALSSAVESGAGAATFAVLLVDGLSMAEEELTDGLLTWLGDEIPLIGGSAGDDLRFAHSRVLVGEEFVPDAATLTLVSTSAPFRPLRVQHHTAGDTVLVVTDASPAERLVHTLNGRAAGEEYAAAVGVGVDRLTPEVFSGHPLVIRAGGAEWVRSISRIEDDGSLRFFCAAERGTVLRLGTSAAATDAIAATFDRVREDLGGIGGVLVFDCILRRLEFESGGIAAHVNRILSGHRAFGFSTFGEQYGGVHVNQTMVGIAFGD